MHEAVCEALSKMSNKKELYVERKLKNYAKNRQTIYGDMANNWTGED